MAEVDEGLWTSRREPETQGFWDCKSRTPESSEEEGRNQKGQLNIKSRANRADETREKATRPQRHKHGARSKADMAKDKAQN